MTKTELISAIKTEGSWDNRQRTRAWEQAFDAFNADPVNKGNRAMMSCPTCWNMVRNWLTR